MNISFDEKRFKKYHLQTRATFQKIFFTKKFLFSLVTFFSVGMMGTPIASFHFWQSFSAPQSVLADTKQEAVSNNEERCYWQEDVVKFFALQEGKKNALQTTVPCEKTPVVQTINIQKSLKVFDNELGKVIYEMTVGYPIEQMIPIIATFDREVAALIVGIAKKESNWGKRVPVDLSGADCFNYWGYKGAGARGVEMGHGCFGSGEEAVLAVGNRLKKLVELRKTSEPKNMIIWKCGSSCAGHSDESVKKWISDVDMYYNQIANN